LLVFLACSISRHGRLAGHDLRGEAEGALIYQERADGALVIASPYDDHVGDGAVADPFFSLREVSITFS
jgi:hypothetical protein